MGMGKKIKVWTTWSAESIDLFEACVYITMDIWIMTGIILKDCTLHSISGCLTRFIARTTTPIEYAIAPAPASLATSPRQITINTSRPLSSVAFNLTPLRPLLRGHLPESFHATGTNWPARWVYGSLRIKSTLWRNCIAGTVRLHSSPVARPWRSQNALAVQFLAGQSSTWLA